MDLSLKRKLLAYMASAALVVGSGSVAPARAQLIEIPEQIVDDLLEDIADDDWPEQDLVRLVELLAEDGFTGFLSVEIINPDDPQAVLAHHMDKYRQYLGESS